MSKITGLSVQEKDKNRCNLFLDGSFCRGLSLEIAVKYGLKVNDEISREKLDEVFIESDKYEALNKAVRYISKSLKTKRQIKDYLIKKEYPEKIVWYCIDKLSEYGYINDEEYARRYIETVSKNQGKRLLEYKLMSKGVKKTDIENAYMGTEINSKDNALDVATKRLKNKEITQELIYKTYRYLLGRGFSYEEADYAISKFKEDL